MRSGFGVSHPTLPHILEAQQLWLHCCKPGLAGEEKGFPGLAGAKPNQAVIAGSGRREASRCFHPRSKVAVRLLHWCSSRATWDISEEGEEQKEEGEGNKKSRLTENLVVCWHCLGVTPSFLSFMYFHT